VVDVGDGVFDSMGIRLPEEIGQLLSLIVRHGAVSRAELERLSGTSRTTIVQRLGALFAANLIVETQETQPSGGRPSRLLKLNDDFALIIAVDIGESLTRVAITDLSPKILVEAVFPTNLDDGPDPVLAEIMACSGRLLEQAGRPIKQVIGLGLCLPARIDYKNARVFGPSVMHGWDDFDIRGWFWDRFQIKVFADNDVNLMALAEYRKYWPNEDYFFFIKAGTGIGGGIVIRGEVFRGGQGSAGDIGHIQLDFPNPPLCRCGKLGCLEAYSGGWAIARDLREKGIEAQNSRDVINLVKRNVPQAIQLLRVAGKGFGEVVADVVSVLNPNLIVLGGTLAQADEHLMAGIRELVNQRCLPLATRQLEIVTARTGDRAGTLGAAQLVIDERLAGLGRQDRG
jgi:predicted NBD/HSP70 family sugar kinase